ncbi:MAG: PKD domain-containing protein, partial [Syntrophothermus sp.]
LANAQNSSQSLSKNDTADFPYWIQMMQDPDANFFKVQRAFNIYWKDRPIVRSHGWKVFKRWEYMMSSRVSPNGDRPAPDATLKAYEAYVASHDRSRTAVNGNWTSLGPSTIPAPGPAGYEGLGRINTVAWHPTDPNKLYIGAPAGGFWNSDDGGATWTTHTDSLATLGVSSILIDPANPSVILIGTGDRDAGDAPGMGVYKSTDGGLTWNPSKTGMDNKTVGQMIQNGQTILAATSGGVYRSTDGGANWTKTASGDFKDIDFKPNDPNTVYAAGGASFYRSTNNGLTFTQIASGLPIGQQRLVIAVTPANSTYVYVLISSTDSGLKGVYRSTDSGLTFTAMMTSPNILDWSCDGSGSGGQGWYDLALAADPVNANTIYVGGVNVWKSTNGGSSFNINSHWYGGCSVPAVHADCHYLAFSPVNGQLYATNDGGIYSTSNGGTSWTDHTVGLTIGQIYKLGQAQKVKNHCINGFQDNGSYAITPTGWVAAGGGDGMECAIDYQLDMFTYHTVYYGDIYRKTNNTAEVHIAGNGVGGINEDGDWVTPFIFHAADPKIMFVGYRNVWRATNVRQGVPAWTKISNLGGTNSPTMRALENSSANNNILYASRNDGTFYRSDDCNSVAPSWISLTSHLPAAGTVLSVETHPADENIVYITQGHSVYKSTDKGLSWTNITGTLPDVTKNCIIYYKNDNEGLYVSTDAGVYYKNSTMTDWVNFSAGLPVNARVTELDIYYDNDSVSQDVIRASTYGRALWSSDLARALPDVDFTASATTTPANCTINFTDLSSNVPTNWLWTFDGATPGTSTVKNPSGIAYSAPGTYSVSLKAWNEAGSDSLTKTGYITVTQAAAPVAEFTADTRAVCDGEVVHFTDLSVNCPSSWQWEFVPSTITYLDGTTASSQNPVVSFDATGMYTVKLTASNNVGGNSNTKEMYIYSGGFMVPFSDDFEHGLAKNSWSVINSDGGKTWDTITVAGQAQGTHSLWMNFFDYGTMSARDQLISPPFNFTNLSGATLYFQHAYAQRGSLKDSLIVKASADCGETWTRLLSLGAGATPDILATHADTIVSFFPQSANDWCGGSYGLNCYVVDLSAYAGMKEVKIMFETYNRHGNNLFLDNVVVSGPVGITGDNSKMNDVSVFPNPSAGVFNVKAGKDISLSEISVYNANGQKIYSEKAALKKDDVRQINLHQISGGIYYLRIVNNKETINEKIIVY